MTRKKTEKGWNVEIERAEGEQKTREENKMCKRRPHPYHRSWPPSCHLSAEREVVVSIATAWRQHSHLSAENIVTVLANDVQVFLWKKRVSCPWKTHLLRIRSVKKADRQLYYKFPMVQENPLPCRENPLPHCSQYRPLLMNHQGCEKNVAGTPALL